MDLIVFIDNKGFMSFRFLSRDMQVIFCPLLIKSNSFSVYTPALAGSSPILPDSLQLNLLSKSHCE